MKKIGYSLALIYLFIPSLYAVEKKKASDLSEQPKGIIRVKRKADQSAYPKNPLLSDQEDIDRMVDEAAVSSKEAAILNLKRLILTKKGSPDEASLLWRLADMEWRATKSHFRVGISRGANTKSNSRYDELMASVVSHTTEILTRFPKFKDSRDVLLRRGRAFQELKKQSNAKEDYLEFIRRYPSDSQVVPVRLMAAEIQFDDNKYQEVLDVLQPINLNEINSGLNGAVVEKQAFSYFHLMKFAEAFQKAEWLLKYDQKKGLDQEEGGHYDQVLGMIALFYGSAVEKGVPSFNLEHAYSYFRELNSGKIFGKLSHEFCLVLRTKDLQSDIFSWKRLVIKNAINEDEVSKTLVTTYDAAITWKNYAELSNLESDFALFFKTNPNTYTTLQNEVYFKKFKATLLGFAENIYKTIPPKNPKVNDYQAVAEPYLKALSSYMLLSDANDTMKANVRFRMGEFFLGLRDWEKAQIMFTEVYQTKAYSVDLKLREESRVKAMTARYDYFKDRGVIPKDLKAVSFKTASKPMPSDVAEWIKWLDEISASKKMDDAFEKLVFEANRIIYSYGQIETAYKRMLYFVGSRPQSKLTPPTAALIMDTLIESEAWVAVRTLSQKFLTMPNVAVKGYKEKLEDLEKDAHFKIVGMAFKTKDYPKVLAMGEEHLKLYPDSKKKTDILALMGKSALEQKDTGLSLKYLNQVAVSNPNHESASIAYFIRAEDEEKKFQFKDAFYDYQKLLGLSSQQSGIAQKDMPQLRKKVFTLGLNSADPKIYQIISQNSQFCGGSGKNDLVAECDRLFAMQALFNENDKRNGWEFIALAEKAPKESRAAWYASAFTKGSRLPTPVLQKSFEDFTRSANYLDPVSQSLTVFSLRKSFKKLFEDKIDEMERESKIIPRLSDLQYTLQKRVKDIARIESLGTSALSIPDPELKVYILGRLSKVFTSFANELKRLPLPKGLKAEEMDPYKQMLGSVILPIEGKSKQIGEQAWEIAAKNGIPTPYSPESKTFTAEVIKQSYSWDFFSAMNRGLSANAKDHPWAKAIQQGNFYAALFFNQLVEQNQTALLNLSIEDQTILQMLTHYQMNKPSELVKVSAARENLLKGEALRLSVLGRIYQFTQAQSQGELEKLAIKLTQFQIKDQSVGELEFLKVAQGFIRTEIKEPEKQSRMPASEKPVEKVQPKKAEPKSEAKKVEHESVEGAI